MDAPADVAGPTVTQYAAPSRPTGVVLMLHGGKDRSADVVDSRSASWRRSAVMARRDLDRGGVRRCRRVAAALPAPRLERRRRTGRGRPLGAGPGARGAGCGAGGAARPLDGGAHVDPRRRRPAGPRRRRAGAVVPRRRAGGGPHGQAAGRRPRPARPDHLRPRHPRVRRAGAPRPVPTRRSSTWAGSATTCCAGSAPGTTWPGAVRWSCWRTEPPAGLAKRNSFVLSFGTKQFRTYPRSLPHGPRVRRPPPRRG